MVQFRFVLEIEITGFLDRLEVWFERGVTTDGVRWLQKGQILRGRFRVGILDVVNPSIRQPGGESLATKLQRISAQLITAGLDRCLHIWHENLAPFSTLFPDGQQPGIHYQAGLKHSSFPVIKKPQRKKNTLDTNLSWCPKKNASLVPSYLVYWSPPTIKPNPCTQSFQSAFQCPLNIKVEFPKYI